MLQNANQQLVSGLQNSLPPQQQQIRQAPNSPNQAMFINVAHQRGLHGASSVEHSSLRNDSTPLFPPMASYQLGNSQDRYLESNGIGLSTAPLRNSPLLNVYQQQSSSSNNHNNQPLQAQQRQQQQQNSYTSSLLHQQLLPDLVQSSSNYMMMPQQQQSWQSNGQQIAPSSSSQSNNFQQATTSNNNRVQSIGLPQHLFGSNLSETNNISLISQAPQFHQYLNQMLQQQGSHQEFLDSTLSGQQSFDAQQVSVMRFVCSNRFLAF